MPRHEFAFNSDVASRKLTEVVLKSENLSLLYIHVGMMKCQKIFLDTRFEEVVLCMIDPLVIWKS